MTALTAVERAEVLAELEALKEKRRNALWNPLNPASSDVGEARRLKLEALHRTDGEIARVERILANG